MQRPVIGIAALRTPKAEGLRRAGIIVPEKIAEAVFRAGGDPVLLPALTDDYRHRLDRVEAVVLPGGRDINPRRYGASSTGQNMQGPYDDRQDKVELQLARDVVEAGIPLLAICRGMQILNVALGGTLIDDLPPSTVNHRSGFHDVTLDSGSAVARAMGCVDPSVSAVHHQAVERLGTGLVASGWAADGCIEAIEHPDRPILAVQWHPEDDAEDNPIEQALFDSFADPTWWAQRPEYLGAQQ
jgi:putative glutamine amidotransferase